MQFRSQVTTWAHTLSGKVGAESKLVPDLASWMLRFRSDTRGDKKSLHKNSLIYRGLKQLILKANGYKDDFLGISVLQFQEAIMKKTKNTFIA